MHFVARWCGDDDSLSYTYCAILRLGLHPGRCLHCGDAAEPGPEWRKVRRSDFQYCERDDQGERRTFRYGPFGGEGFWCD